MTLTDFLELDESLMDEGDYRCLSLAKDYYERAGAPTDKAAVAELLERVLLRCQSKMDPIPYPKILLLRKRQLEGRQRAGAKSWAPWQPPAPAAPRVPPSPAELAATRVRDALQMLRELRPHHPPEMREEWEERLLGRVERALNKRDCATAPKNAEVIRN